MPEDAALWINDDIHLVYAQLLVAFRHITLDGSLVICLPTRPLNWVVDIIAILRQSFSESLITAVNLEPDGQAKRPVAYIVCRRYGAPEGTRSLHISRLHHSIQSMKRTDGPVVPRLSGASEGTILSSQQPFVLNLLEPVWKRQYDATQKNRYPK